MKQKRAVKIDSESESEAEAPQMETETPKTQEPTTNATLKRSTFGRGKPKTTGDHTSPGFPLETPGKVPALDNMGPLTINTGHMTEEEIHQAIQDARTAEQELFIRDENGKVPINSNTNLKNNLETSDLELASNLSSSTEIEADIITEEEKNVRRLKRLTKTNPIVRYNNPVCHDYRKHRKRAELGQHTGSTKQTTGERTTVTQLPDKIQMLREYTNRNNNKSQERSTVHQHTDLWGTTARRPTTKASPLPEHHPTVEGGV